MKILETKHLKKYYGQGDSLVKAVDDVSISVEKGEVCCKGRKVSVGVVTLFFVLRAV